MHYTKNFAYLVTSYYYYSNYIRYFAIYSDPVLIRRQLSDYFDTRTAVNFALHQYIALARQGKDETRQLFHFSMLISNYLPFTRLTFLPSIYISLLASLLLASSTKTLYQTRPLSMTISFPFHTHYCIEPGYSLIPIQ